jgi:hypothetical protein
MLNIGRIEIGGPGISGFRLRVTLILGVSRWHFTVILALLSMFWELSRQVVVHWSAEKIFYKHAYPRRLCSFPYIRGRVLKQTCGGLHLKAEGFRGRELARWKFHKRK